MMMMMMRKKILHMKFQCFSLLRMLKVSGCFIINFLSYFKFPSECSLHFLKQQNTPQSTSYFVKKLLILWYIIIFFPRENEGKKISDLSDGSKWKFYIFWSEEKKFVFSLHQKAKERQVIKGKFIILNRKEMKLSPFHHQPEQNSEKEAIKKFCVLSIPDFRNFSSSYSTQLNSTPQLIHLNTCLINGFH